jgi:hypothetical protein
MKTVNRIHYEDVVNNVLLVGTLDHNVFQGFLEDYRTLSCLLKEYKPNSVFEVGTNVGSGINVMAAALPLAKIYSLDLDYETMMLNSKQYPIGPNGEDRVGSAARVQYTQLRGDSLTFDYSAYPCEAYYVDGEHDYDHPFKETKEILKQKPKIVIYHDADIPEVFKGIVDGGAEDDDYVLFRVEGTRIAFYLHKNFVKW